jgi:hypothetical protein
MAKRLAKYEVTYQSGATRVKQLTEGDAERLEEAGATVKKRTPQNDKKRTPQKDKGIAGPSE